MAISRELAGFVREALARGVARADVQDVLVRAGWDPDQVRTALDGYAEIDFPIPVPRPEPYLSAREAFVYLVLFATLYVCAYNLGTLLLQFIDLAFPDPAVPGTEEYSRAAIRWAVSSLIVAFPVFAYVSRWSARAVRSDPRKRGSLVRRWLTYLTLFAAAGVLIGDLIALVYRFLGGEMTVRFALKVATIGLIAGSIFGYYLWDLRLEEKEGEE
jgi:hypothetical protein